MEWNKETVLHFLNLIRERPVIWDAQCRDYKDKIKRNIAIEQIALLMGCTVKTVHTKWTSLKNQYSREKRNMTGMRTGSGANDVYATKWYCFKEMESLMDGNKPEQTYDNLSESSSSLPMPRPQSTPTPPLFQPPSTTTPPQLRPPNAPTPPLLRPPNTPTPPPLRSPNTPTPPPLRSPNTPAPPLLQLNNTSTPPLQSPSIPPASTKRKKTDRNTVYKEAIDTLKTIRDDRSTRRNESIINKSDDITAYGLYIAAQIRMFRPILQSKIKLDIQTLLYKYEMENINYRSDSSMSDHSDYYSDNQNPDSPMFSDINTTDTQVSNVPQISVPNASTFKQSDNSIASTSSFRQIDFKHIQMSENRQTETTPLKKKIVISNNGSIKESLIPELRDNSVDLPGVPQETIFQNEIINTSNTTTQMDGTLNDSLQPELSENSADLPGLPQLVILPQTNTPTQMDGTLNDSLQPEFSENSADLPGLPQIVILPQTNTPTQMDGTLNDSLQPEFSENSADLPGLPQIVILPQTNTPTQTDTETQKAIEYLLKFKY